MIEDVTIDLVTDGLEKSKIVKEVLLDLPEWFGIPESLEGYVKEAEHLPLWVAKVAQETVGFICLKETSEETAELSCMGIKKKFHHNGIGKQLFAAFEAYAKERYLYLQVKTLNEGISPDYDRTIRYYKSCGFSKLEVFPLLWDEHNPCLVLVKKIEK